MRVTILVFWCALVPVSVALAQTETPVSSAQPATTGAHRYAVTLLSSFEPIADALLPTEFKQHHVYRTQSVVFGKTIYFVRLGFFATSSEATTMRNTQLARYPGAFMTQVTEEEYRTVVPSMTRLEKPAAKPKAPPAPPNEEIFVVTLSASQTQAPTPAGPLPAQLKGKRFYLRDTVQNDGTLRSLQLGFFTSAAEAEMAKTLLLATYPEAVVRPASKQERSESARTLLAIPNTTAEKVTSPANVTLPAVAVSGDLEKKAGELLEQARAALTRGDNAAAIQILNQLLQLPPNSNSVVAQELIGLAHERNGEISLAKREYNLCLQLYPDWTGADRVRQRLADLDTTPTKPILTTPKAKAVSISTAYGSFSQYYYRGNSHVETTPTTPSPTPQPALDLVDQSSLITNVDLTGRIRSGDYDNRVVLRDSYTLNFLEDRPNTNRLYDAYAEIRNIPHDYSGRLGRQPGNSGGVLGRFDGITAGYNFLPKWRINVVAGEPVDFHPINSTKQFWGTSLDVGTFAEHWNGSGYYINQTVDGILDRQAVGAELRYFNLGSSLMTLLDYDLSYSTLNIGLLQGNLQVGSKTNLNLLIDHRMAPVLQTSNAVIGEVDTSIKSQLLTLTEDQLRAQAEARTPTSDLVMIGATYNFNPTWQLGGDIKRYNISGTPASGTLPATPGTGDIYVYTVQGIGTGLLTRRDVSVLSLSHLNGELYTGNSIAFSNRTLYQDKWSFDLSLTYYMQHFSNVETDLTRLTPAVRVSYRWRERITFEGEVGVEKNKETGSADTIDTNRYFYTLGYRWDF
jgi:tetratricopeptide (TPR) repeat protein